MDLDTKRKYFLGEELYGKCKNGSASSYDMLKRAKQLGMTIEQIVNKCELNFSDSPRKSTQSTIETSNDDINAIYEGSDDESSITEPASKYEDEIDETAAVYSGSEYESEMDDDNPIEWDD